MLAEGLNNAINSTTVVAVLIASVAFAAIYTVPGEYIDDPNEIPPGQYSLGEANVAPNAPFIIFFVFDSTALFISLADVVAGANISRSHREQGEKTDDENHKQTDVDSLCPSFRRISSPIFVVAGERERWLAIGVTIIGATITATTFGTMCYWVTKHRIEASNMKNIRRSSIGDHTRFQFLCALGN